MDAVAVAGRVAAFVAGAAAVALMLVSALRTVVVPRAESTLVGRFVFRSVRALFDLRARFARSYEERDRVMALFGPLSLVLLPFAWVLVVVAGYTGMFWGTGVDPLSLAFRESASSITTLGVSAPSGLAGTVLAFSEAIIGLGLVALLISYLPTIYGAFQRRELEVALLDSRAGDPPAAATLLIRHHRIGEFDRILPLFARWEAWFADVEETHTSQAALTFFRSPLPGRSWVTAAGAVLDAAALLTSTVDLPVAPEPQLCLRAGSLSLRRIADFYGIQHDPDPAPDDPISISRDEYDAVCAELVAAGLRLRPDRDQAWRDFAGWRVNYDTVLVTLAGLTMAPYAPWSSDRSISHRVRVVPAKVFLARLRRHRGAHP